VVIVVGEPVDCDGKVSVDKKIDVESVGIAMNDGSVDVKSVVEEWRTRVSDVDKKEDVESMGNARDDVSVEDGSVDVKLALEESREDRSDEEDTSMVEVLGAEEKPEENDELTCSVSVEVPIDLVVEEDSVDSVDSSGKEMNDEGSRGELSDLVFVVASGASKTVDSTYSYLFLQILCLGRYTRVLTRCHEICGCGLSWINTDRA